VQEVPPVKSRRRRDRRGAARIKPGIRLLEVPERRLLTVLPAQVTVRPCSLLRKFDPAPSAAFTSTPQRPVQVVARMSRELSRSADRPRALQPPERRQEASAGPPPHVGPLSDFPAHGLPGLSSAQPNSASVAQLPPRPGEFLVQGGEEAFRFLAAEDTGRPGGTSHGRRPYRMRHDPNGEAHHRATCLGDGCAELTGEER